MKRILWSALLCAAVCRGALDETLLRARDAQDRPELDRLVAAAKAAADRAPKNAEAQYRLALTESIAGEVALEQKDKPAAERAAGAGIPAAEAAVALRPQDAEYNRVLGTLCGQIIPANIFRAIGYGKRAKEAIEKAKQLDPKSPEVWIAEGVGNYYMPASFGGGPDPAIRSFEHALQLDPKSAEAWLWLGLAQRKKQKYSDARESFRKSLALDPNRVWVKEQLAKTPVK